MATVTDTAFQLNQHIDLIKFQPFYELEQLSYVFFFIVFRPFIGLWSSSVRGSSIKNAIDMRNCIIYAEESPGTLHLPERSS